MARSKAYLFGGVEIRWRCDAALLARHRRRAGRGDLPFPRRPEGLSRRARSTARRWCIPTSSPADPSKHRRARRRSNGRSPGPPTATASSRSYCNTIPTPRWRHPRGRPAHRAAARRCKAYAELHRPRQARRHDHRRRRDDRRRRDALGLHPRAGIPGPDQGPAGHRARRSASSKTRSRPFRPLAGRQSPARRPSCSTSSSSAPTSGCAAARKRRSRARPRRASCACPASSPTARSDRGRRHRAVHRRGRLGRRHRQAGARPQDPGDPAAARQDPQRRQRRQRTSSPPTRRSPI